MPRGHDQFEAPVITPRLIEIREGASDHEVEAAIRKAKMDEHEELRQIFPRPTKLSPVPKTQREKLMSGSYEDINAEQTSSS